MGGWNYYFFEFLLPFFGPPMIGVIIGHWVGGRAVKGAFIGTLGGWAGIALFWGYQAVSASAGFVAFSTFLLAWSVLGGWLGAWLPRGVVGGAAESPITGDSSKQADK